jgi:hydroxyacylglutathione hydrolase
MEQWSHGIYLLGRYNPFSTGCWLLCKGGEGAILECPPYSRNQPSPALAAAAAARQLGVTIKYLLCSHYHGDHFSPATLRELHHQFPHATILLQDGFPTHHTAGLPTQRFDQSYNLNLDGEPLYLIHAPKHSWTDTMVIFRGVIFTGDWELNTLRSVHDGKGHLSVPAEQKLRSIETMLRFPTHYNYHIHKVFSVHANDRRENVDFTALMQDTKTDRSLW